MAPLAIYLTQGGRRVSGEDDALTEEVGALLRAAGVEVGPLPPGTGLVVHSSAIPPSHPSRAAAASLAAVSLMAASSPFSFASSRAS